jgi:hypothetical protein
MAGRSPGAARRPAALALAGAWVLLGACTDTTRSPVALCTRVLLMEFPDAELRAAAPGPAPHSPRLLFEAEPRDDFPGLGRFACETRPSAHGTLRLESAGLDERPLSEAELALINADLLLEDLRAAAPDPDAPI